MANGLRFISHPTVSGVLLPLSPEESVEGAYLDLSLGTDYRIGKLIRSGLDAVHGFDENGNLEYDAVKVRSLLPTIDQHIGRRKTAGSSHKVLVHQGHGNIGLNNYAVACKNEGDGSYRLILPAGEPLHERVYPCFVKKSGGDGRPPEYAVEDLIFFLERDNGFPAVPWDATKGAPHDAKMLDRIPDRELEGADIYIPIWNPGLTGKPLRRIAYDERIDWGQTNVEFAKVPRGSSGIGEKLNLRPVSVIQGNPALFQGLIEGIEFAFFGIPVESLNRTQVEVGRELARQAHYYYDLRHLIDLVGVGSPEFYLLEHALKRDGYTQARELLRAYVKGSAAPGPLVVDIHELLDLTVTNSAHAAVLGTLYRYRADRTSLIRNLQAKGYEDVGRGTATPEAGQFCFDEQGRCLTVWPRRNTYSYSFIGLITSPNDQRYLLLAVTGGHGGLRSHGGHFEGALATSLTLEAAVRAVYQNLAGLWGKEVAPHGEDRLLLLDQGGDVHQWIGVGGLGYVVGSSEKRDGMSALLTVLA